MPYKHRRHFILTNFTLPRLRTPGTPAFLQAICLEPYIRNFVRPPLGHSSHMAAPPALSHTTHTSMNLSSPFSVRVCFARLSRAYNPSHCIWLTLLGVSVNPLPGVTPSFEICSSPKPFMASGCGFVGYFYRFGRRTCHTISKLIKHKGHMDW